MSKNGKVLVAMSGGIDSTMAAIMLHEQGYEVIGITIKTWDYASSGGNSKETGCCSLDSINDARAAAVNLGFHHFIVDLREDFGQFVIDDFINEYLAGRTPNPCVLCNTHVKWELLLQRAEAMDCAYLATGHYAKINRNGPRYFISMGKDKSKDQSYVLWGVSQSCLSKTLFPLGNFEKSEIKEMAKSSGLTELANKNESYEICFVPDNDYRGFLKRKIPSLEQEVSNGDFIDSKGNVIGKHNGYPFYTIGQRKGLGVAFGEPMYVTRIYPDTNRVELGPISALHQQGMWVGDTVFQKYDSCPDELKVKTKIRYKHEGAMSTISKVDSRVKVRFDDHVSAIAPGQSAVFYENEDLVGGGRIISSFELDN